MGAGPWYSVLTNRHSTQRSLAVGISGKSAQQNSGSHNICLKDFAILGEIDVRIDSDEFEGLGSVLSENLRIQHVKVGAWMEGPMNNFKLINSRITDTMADGVNFHKGVTNSVVENTLVRNTGDDALGMWAQDIPNVNNNLIHNTVAPGIFGKILHYRYTHLTL